MLNNVVNFRLIGYLKLLKLLGKEIIVVCVVDDKGRFTFYSCKI